MWDGWLIAIRPIKSIGVLIMKPLNEIFTFRFFRSRNGLSWRSMMVCSAIVEVLRPNTVVDMGCSIGDFIKSFRELGIEAYGIDGSPACLDFLNVPKEFIEIVDLRVLQEWTKKYDLAVSFEVAEHIEPEYADIFIQNLVNSSDKVIFTAARPGYIGHYHVNCQRNYYWSEKFEKQGYLQDFKLEEQIKVKWWEQRTEPGIKSIYDNLMCFVKVTRE
jgi:hypothetical protein